MTAAGGWASLQSVLADERSYRQTWASEALLACPQCGEPMIGNVCSFEAVRITQNGPPAIAEETMSASDPGPWESLVGILRDNADNSKDESRTPPVACPRDGTPLVSGHCTYCGWQTVEFRED